MNYFLNEVSGGTSEVSSSPQAAVFVLPRQSINELLQNHHTTSVIIKTMMYSLLCVGLKEAWDSSAEACGSQILPVEGRDDPLPCQDTTKMNREYFCTIFLFFFFFSFNKNFYKLHVKVNRCGSFILG